MPQGSHVMLNFFVNLASLVFHVGFPQFTIYNKTMIGSAQGSQVHVRITLQRVFIFHLTNTYMPGLFLVSIKFLYFFFVK